MNIKMFSQGFNINYTFKDSISIMNNYKEGDVVRVVTNDFYYNTPKGTECVVHSIDDDSDICIVRADAYEKTKHLSFWSVDGNIKEYADATDIELVDKSKHRRYEAKYCFYHDEDLYVFEDAVSVREKLIELYDDESQVEVYEIKKTHDVKITKEMKIKGI